MCSQEQYSKHYIQQLRGALQLMVEKKQALMMQEIHEGGYGRAHWEQRAIGVQQR